ncbi:hypothetical protein [Domibacillus iocasae]|uniref:hypothetical protein n=1 Tax=Domibacillus iocasae TaxID=1714016 RepID=UPI001B8035E5
MIVGEPFIYDYFANPFVKYGFELVVVAGILLAGTLKQRRMERAKNKIALDENVL